MIWLGWMASQPLSDQNSISRYCLKLEAVLRQTLYYSINPIILASSISSGLLSLWPG